MPIQLQDVNAYWFSTRTRAFNNMFYWMAQIVGAGLFGFFLDWTRFSRRTRSLTAWVIMFVLVNAIWGGGTAFLMKTHRGKKGPAMDVFDHNYIWYLIVSLFSVSVGIERLTNNVAVHLLRFLRCTLANLRILHYGCYEQRSP